VEEVANNLRAKVEDHSSGKVRHDVHHVYHFEARVTEHAQTPNGDYSPKVKSLEKYKPQQVGTSHASLANEEACSASPSDFLGEDSDQQTLLD
jgi:hypothetical protein